MRHDLTGSETATEQQFDQALHNKVLVYIYWPGRDSSEPDIGFGAYRMYMLYFPVIFVLSLIGIIVFYWLGLEQLSLITAILMLLCGVLLFSLVFKYYGYYEVDKQGRPVRFLTHNQPDSIMGRRGFWRAKSLIHHKK